MHCSLRLVLALCSSLCACSSGGPSGNNNFGMNPGADAALEEGDGGGSKDGGTTGDDGGKTGDDGGGNMQGLPCSPGAYRCGPGVAVEICNSSGTAWLHAQSCAVSCVAGLCTGVCTPGQRRCNGKAVEECNGAGTAFGTVENCATFCAGGQCALQSLEITMNRNMSGEVLVAGDIIVRSGVTLTAERGDLTLRGRSIIVENGATITAAAKGDNAQGRGAIPSYTPGGGGGGSYGSQGSYDGSGYAPPGGVHGSSRDALVEAGSPGGDCRATSFGCSGGPGGGVLRLIAETSINIAGFVTANGMNGGSSSSSSYGGGGGGSGGGILLAAASDITVTGSVSAQGGMGGTGNYRGGSGGMGRVKILAGGKRTLTGTITGEKTEGLLPPLLITSSSHPDPDLVYNDDFPNIQLAWVRPFGSRQGYYQMINTQPSQPPTPATGTFVNTEMTMFMPGVVRQGANYFHVVPVDAMSNVGTVESVFRIQINTSAPSLSSTSHPNQMSWYENPNVFYGWSFPVHDRNLKGMYYVLDNYGDTVPTRSATFVPISQKQLLRSDLPPGIWVLHAVSVDQRDYLTKAAGHYRVHIGKDPGTGVVLGQVTDMAGKPVDGASVTINRGLYTQAANATGNYNFPKVPAGTFELSATKAGFMPATQMITVMKDGSTTANITLK